MLTGTSFSAQILLPQCAARVPRHSALPSILIAVCFPMCSYFAFSRHVSRGRYRPFTRASYRKLPEVQLSHIYQGKLSPIDQGKLSQISEVKLSQTPGGYYPVSPMSSRPVSVIRSARRFPRRLRAVMTVCSPLSSHTPGGDFPEYLPISSQPVAVIRRAGRRPWLHVVLYS